MIIILMGVTGAGKTTVGRALAAELGWKFCDADDFHSAANIARMRAGIPLTDADRASWLQALHDAIAGWIASGQPIVLACSALKASYRKQLVIGPEVKLVYLRGSFALIAKRVASRPDHYMNPNLLLSQFEALEEPSDALVIDVGAPIPEIVRAIRKALTTDN
jgi:gluconokinase